MNLKLMCYALRFRERMSHIVLATDITLDAVRAMKTHHEWEDGHKDVDSPDFSEKDWHHMIKAIEEWMHGFLGVTKIPLAYVIRLNELVKPGGKGPCMMYTSVVKELVSCAPIHLLNGWYTQDFLSDRESLCGTNCFQLHVGMTAGQTYDQHRGLWMVKKPLCNLRPIFLERTIQIIWPQKPKVSLRVLTIVVNSINGTLNAT